MTISLVDIVESLRKEDIEGLLALGAPGDEYDSEAKEIFLALETLNQEQLTEANIVGIIALAWAKSFNRSPQEIEQRLPAFQRIAMYLVA